MYSKDRVDTVMYVYEHACTWDFCPCYCVMYKAWIYLVAMSLSCMYNMCNCQSCIISLLNGHAFCTNFREFYDTSTYVNCGVFFFNFIFSKKNSFELHAGIICNKEDRSILFQCHWCFDVIIIPVQYSSVRFVTCYIVFNVQSDVHETFLTR